MRVFQTNKRRMVRSQKRVDRFIGYANLNSVEGPSLHVEMPGGYAVGISYRDLAHLVRRADEHAVTSGVQGLESWREFT